MTDELKAITKKIDVAFTIYFWSKKEVETIFVVGSMAKNDYQDRFANDYDIRVISKRVTKEDIEDFNYFLKQLSKTLTTDKIEVSYSTLVGPVNHKVSDTKKNVLIHAMIHEKSQMDDFLPETHKYQYGKRYRIVYGIDNLKKFRERTFTLDDLLNGHEGLNYTIDMLKKHEYRYLDWDIENDNVAFNYHAVPIDKDTIYECCFYSVNKFIDNLMNYCKFNGYQIPNHKMDFTLELLGSNIKSPTLFLLDGLFRKDEVLLMNIFPDIIDATIKLLEKFQERVQLLDLIFAKNIDNKRRKLVKN